jgi:hypothetical protein
MADKKKKSLTERIEEASKRPLPYEGLTSSTGDSLWPSEGDHHDSAFPPSDRERFNSLLNAAVQKRG